jgi:hypothetical protein
LEESVSPILVRPVREQLEHDRIIRLLQSKFKRKHEVGINPGAEQTAGVGVGPSALFPDLVLTSTERGRRLQGVVEVETGESVNHLEALAQWAHYSRLRVPFHLYVPAGMVDVARRLCEDNHIYVAEIWSFHTVGDQVRFTLVHRNRQAPPPQPRAKAVAAKPVVMKPAAAKPEAIKPVAAAKPVVTTKPVTTKPVTTKPAAPPKPSPPKSKPARPAKKAKAKPAKKKPARSAKRR